MNIRLDHLERVAQKNKPVYKPTHGIFKEIKSLIVIFCIVFVAMLIFTNINLFANSLSSTLDLSVAKQVKNRDNKTANTNNSISTIIENNEIKLTEIQNLIDTYST